MTAHWTETVELNGHPFFIRHWGDKDAPKLLMLHGFPEYSGAWNDLAPLLATRFHCIAPDQRGYGQSWRPAQVAQYKTSQLVSDMAALIGDEPVILLGHDWGASVAYALTIGRPELVSKLIIMNGVHPAPFQRELAKGGPQTDASQYIHFLRREGSEDILAADGFAKLMGLFSAHMDMDWLQGDTLAGYKAAWRDAAGLRGMVNWYRASPLKLGHTGEAIDDAPAAVERKHAGLAHELVGLKIVEYHILLGGILRKIGMHDEAGLIYSNALRLEPDNLEVFLEAADNLQKDDRHDEAISLLDGVPLPSAQDPMVVCRRFVSLYSLGQTKHAYSLLDASLEKTPDLCTTLVELFPGISQDAEFSLRVLNAPKNQ